MDTFMRSLRIELYKLSRRKKYTVFLIIGLLICALTSALGNLITSLLAGSNVGLVFNTGATPLNVLPFFSTVLLPLLIFMGATDLFTVEASDGTARASIIRPVTRFKLYLSKLAALGVYTALYLFLILTVGTLGDIISGQFDTAARIGTVFMSYLLSLIPLMTLICFAALISLFSRSGTLVMLILLLLYLLMSVMPLFLPITGELLFTSFIGWYKLWLGAIPGAGKIINVTLTVFSYTAVFLIGGSMVFENKDF